MSQQRTQMPESPSQKVSTEKRSNVGMLPLSLDIHGTQGEQIMNRSVDEAFPHLTAWVKAHGWIEIGYDDAHRSFIRALDSGGMIWEGRMVYATLESALQALDDTLDVWLKENVEHK